MIREDLKDYIDIVSTKIIETINQCILNYDKVLPINIETIYIKEYFLTDRDFKVFAMRSVSPLRSLLVIKSL